MDALKRQEASENLEKWILNDHSDTLGSFKDDLAELLKYDGIPVEETVSAETAASEVVETVDSEEMAGASTPEEAEKLSWRARVSRKLGALATEAKIAYTTQGGPLGMMANAIAKGSNNASEKLKNVSEQSRKEKVKTALAVTAFGVLAAAGAYGAHKTYPHMFDFAMDAVPQPEVHDLGLVDGEMINQSVSAKVLTGGMGDGRSEFIRGMLSGSPFVEGDVTQIHYPAEAAPLNGTHTFDQSVNIGADATYNAIKAKLEAGEHVDVVSYSQGTVATKEAVDRIVAENGGVMPDNLNAIFLATPNIQTTGLYHNGVFQLVEPLLNAAGANLDHGNLPAGSEVYARTTDIVSNSGDRPITTVLSQAAGYLWGDGHALTAEDIADTSRHTSHMVDGVLIHSVQPEGTQTAALRAAEMHNLPGMDNKEWVGALDRFGEAVAPQGVVGKENPGIDLNEAAHAGAEAARVWTKTWAPEHSDAVNHIADFVQSNDWTPPAPAADPVPVPAPEYIAPTPAPAPEYVPPAPVPDPIAQVEQVINDAAAQWAPAAPVEVPAPSFPTFEVPQPVVDQVSEAVAPYVAPQDLQQAQDFMSQFVAQ